MSPIHLAEAGWLPDFAVRYGIRRLLRTRLEELEQSSDPASRRLFLRTLRESPLAIATDAANHQHYEVPAEFFKYTLGPRLKYSCCLFNEPGTTLVDAEVAMLRETCERAQLQDGQQILELGCGWGSLSLWMAENYPESSILAISNSHSQREFIQQQASLKGIANLEVVTEDMRSFGTDRTFDRIVSVEMFEHMRNYELLLQRVSEWLAPRGRAFVHIFCHKSTPYLFETEGESNWMGRHFFTGGMMPSESIFDDFKHHMTVEQSWRVDGTHYAKTSEEWLSNLDVHRSVVTERLARDMPLADARKAVARWRIFFMACAELFRYAGGSEWFVGHYRLQHTNQPSPLVPSFAVS